MIAELVAPEAEREILAALAFHGREAWLRLAPLGLTAAALTPEHRGIWTVLVHLAGSGSPANAVTVEFAAKMLGVPDVANDPLGALEVATMSLGDLPAIVAHGKIVAELAQRRSVIEAANRMSAAASDRGVAIEAVVREQFGQLTTKGNAATVSSDALNETLRWLDRRHEAGTTPLGVCTGIPDLDTALDGLFPGRLVVLAARPGCGKSAFAVWTAHQASRIDIPVLFASLEMPAFEVWERRLSLALKADLKWEARRGNWPGFRDKVTGFRDQLEATPMVIDEQANTVGEIGLAVHRMAADERRPQLVIVDHLGWMRHDAPKTMGHHLAVGQTTKGLKSLAKQEDLCVVLLVQLNRESVKAGAARRPQLSDLGDSGEIERDADQVVMLWEPEPPETFSAQATVEFVVAKNRHGPITRVSAEWSKGMNRYAATPWLPRMVAA